MASSLPVRSVKAATGLIAFSTLVGHAVAFHDDSRIAEDETISSDPLDATLWLHIFVMMLSVGILYPIGMVLGMTKNRWHIPVQILATSLVAFGYLLGYFHKGRMFRASNVHTKFSGVIFIAIATQCVAGFYLWLPFGVKSIGGRIGSLIRPVHSVLGKTFPVIAWVQMIFGGITTLGFCQGDHTGQCAAHFIMGGAFIGYATVMALFVAVGQRWLRRSGRSQEFFDSIIIAAFGCVNTFTEHHWGTAWVKNDWQHTTIGVIWWATGLVGIWLSTDRFGNPKRNFIPGFVLIVTGWGMSSHPQETMTSTMVHKMFGYCLMGAGVTRIIEICFVLRDQAALTDDGYSYSSFQYLPIFVSQIVPIETCGWAIPLLTLHSSPKLLYLSGFLLMSATEEQMNLIEQSDMDHVSFIFITISMAALTFLFANFVIRLYDNLSSSIALPNDHQRIPQNDVEAERQAAHASEFELAGLTDDEDDDEHGFLAKNGGSKARSEGTSTNTSSK
ncbi:Protein YTP1 [Ceratocystis platani]|uniref:Protein YTP1 n=1 Tax=Ceratocystis fimbriata f. sp. platani TaxID=88771 RepID=A0A0F8DAG5_CERFI|nr:Protein YTP1 [Ceratocystis platani]